MNSENFLREKKEDKQIKNRAKNSSKRWDAFNKKPSIYYVITYKRGQKRANAVGYGCGVSKGGIQI